MKKTEITIGEDYAVGQNLNHPGRIYGLRYRAVKTGIERRDVAPKGYRQHQPEYPNDGVQMERIDAGGKATGIFDVIRSHDVFMPWHAYLQMIAKRDAEQIARDAKQKEKNAEIRARLDALIPYDEQPEQVQNLATNDTPFHTRHYGSSAEDLVALLEQATKTAERKRSDPSISSVGCDTKVSP